MSRYYYSVYGPLIKQFIDAKRTFGYKYAMVEQECARFDRFAYDNDENDIGISKGLATQWCAKKPNESVKTRRNRVQIIRVFSAYLCSVGYQSYVPQMPRAKSTFIPYIFSRDEIENIFLTSNCLQPAENSPNSSVFAIPCLFRLLYGTGIRINEALRLSCQDVNLMDKYLVLHDNKNGKDRMVPISNSLTIVNEKLRKECNLLEMSIGQSLIIVIGYELVSYLLHYSSVRCVTFKELFVCKSNNKTGDLEMNLLIFSSHTSFSVKAILSVSTPSPKKILNERVPTAA